MIASLLIIVGTVIVCALLLLVVAILWGGLTYREIPLFSEGDEPRTVRVLRPPYDQDHEGGDAA